MDYEKDIAIDETALDLDWLGQPALMMKYARHSAQMQKTLEETKQNLDIVKAEVALDIRKTPANYGIEKVTDASVESCILTTKKYKDAHKEYLEAKYEADMAKGAVNAFDQRKSALENLVKLHGQQYFAGPRIPHDLTWERQQRQKKSDSKVATKMRRA